MVTKPRDENNKEKEKTYKNKLKTIKKMALGTYIYVQCLNQRHRLAEWIQKQDLYTSTYAICERGTYRLKMKGWKKGFHANGNQQKVGIAVFISDKIDFKMKIVTQVKKEYAY